MEYVQVLGPKERTVFIDGRPAGLTNTTLMVETGTHEFNLDQPVNYRPSSQLAMVTNTTSISPFLIKFENQSV